MTTGLLGITGIQGKESHHKQRNTDEAEIGILIPGRIDES